MTPQPSLYKRFNLYIAIVIILFLFFAPAPKNKPSLQAFVSSADACPFKCVRCTSWDPDAWPRTCLTYECDAECEAGDPGGGGGGNQPPSISHTLTCTQNGLNSWCIGALSIDLSASDPQNAAVVISGDVNGANFTCTTNPCTLNLPEGSGLVTYKVDSATGLSASGSAFYYLDVTTPQVSGSLNGTLGTTGWYISQPTVTASASDVLSGIAALEMNVDNNGWVTYSDTTFIDGMHTIQYRAYDNAGNLTETTVQPINVDTVTPVLNVSVSGVMGNNNWYISNVTLTPTASDPSTGSGQASGLASLEASIDGAPFTSYGSPITLTDGIHSVQFRATDNAGNTTQTAPQELKVDTVTPGLSLPTSGTLGLNGWYRSNVSVTPNASDAGSGIYTIETLIDGGAWVIANSPSSFSDGVHTYQYKVTDNAGNVTNTPVLSIKVDTIAPSLSAPTSLNVLETLGYELADATSGLNQFSLTIAEKDNRHPATGSAWTLMGTTSNGSYRWNALFGNDAVAEVGLHPLTLRLTDMAGNETVQTGTFEVTWKNLVYLELTGNTEQVNNASPSNSSGSIAYAGGPVTSNAIPSNESSALPEPAFGGETNQTPAEQTTTTVTEGGAQSTLEGMSLQAGGATFNAGNQSTNVPLPNSNILWGAAASAVLGATLAEWQRRREEEEAARRAAMQNSGSSDSDEIPADVLARRRARVIAKNETKREQERRWEAARQAENQKNEEAIEAAWNQSRRAHSLESMSATIHANAVQQALETQRAGERENVVVVNSSFSNLWNSQVTPLINNLSNQWNNFTHNITTPSNFSGPLFNLPIVNGLTSFGSIIDNTLFNGQITRSTSQLNNTLESYPAYHAVNNALSFGMGATLQYINDMSFGLVDRFVNFENGNDAFQSGMEFGRTASTIYGAVEFVAGAAATAFFLSSIPPTGGATVACGATTAGLCLPIGGAALTAEAAGAVAGGVVMTHGIALEAYIANNPLQIRGNGGGLFTPKPPGFTSKWWKEGKKWVDPKTGKKWYFHAEDDTHYAHWDVEIPGGGKDRIPLDPSKGVFKER